MRRFTLLMLIGLVVLLIVAAVIQSSVKPGRNRDPRITPSPTTTAP